MSSDHTSLCISDWGEPPRSPRVYIKHLSNSQNLLLFELKFILSTVFYFFEFYLSPWKRNISIKFDMNVVSWWQSISLLWKEWNYLVTDGRRGGGEEDQQVLVADINIGYEDIVNTQVCPTLFYTGRVWLSACEVTIQIWRFARWHLRGLIWSFCYILQCLPWHNLLTNEDCFSYLHSNI